MGKDNSADNKTQNESKNPDVTNEQPPESPGDNNKNNMFSLDGFLARSKVVRTYNPYLLHGFPIWMKHNHSKFLSSQHPINEWEDYFIKYTKHKV